MGAVKTLSVSDSFHETRDLLRKMEKDPMNYEISGNRILILLQEIREDISRKGHSVTQLQNIEYRWRRMNIKKPVLEQVKKTVQDTQSHIEELIYDQQEHRKKQFLSDMEKTNRKDKIHTIRNMLQKLYLADNRETTIHWGTFKKLNEQLQEKIFEGYFSDVLIKYQPTINEWKKIHKDMIFMINTNQDEAFKAIQTKMGAEKILRLGKYIEQLLDEITKRIHDWEMEMKLY